MGIGGGVQRIEMTERETPVFNGTKFGAVGPYERLHGTVFGELDLTHRLNAGLWAENPGAALVGFRFRTLPSAGPNLPNRDDLYRLGRFRACRFKSDALAETLHG
jgi:hypothetical protein